MSLKSILSTIALFFCISLSAQEVREYDGSGNNLANPEWGSAEAEMPRISVANYADGISEPAGQGRPNPRVISNALFAQNGYLGDPMNLSDYLWVFGQFLDHDVVEVEGNPQEPAFIPVDFPDPHFNPGGAYQNVFIPMSRNMPFHGTGTSIGNPRQHENLLTSWIDGSNVYGSDEVRANYLRSFVDGKMKTSSGNLLPWNTISNEKDGPLDANAPFMADDVGFSHSLFVAGDVRANEQPLLIGMHTLFVREHNRLCDIILAEHPDWTDEQIYQKARKIVGGQLQSITYNEWLPAMGVNLPAYSGYDASIDATITNEFSAAAFRLGHTLLNSTILRMDDQGNTIPEGNLSLAQGFFNPAVVYTVGLEPYFKGMATQVEQQMDCKLIDDVRNFLFGPPGSGGLDLAAININRGRERGVPDLNTIRNSMGLTPHATFTHLNPDPTISGPMATVYDNNLDEIDAWVGMLAEEPMPGALFGETIMAIMESQFMALREGDRFFYLNDDGLTEDEKMTITSTKFRDIIMRNTNVLLMQENVFLATPHEDLCGASEQTAEFTGTVKNLLGTDAENVEVQISTMSGTLAGSVSAQSGTYTIANVPTCTYYNMSATVDSDNFRDGVSTLDLVLLARHTVGLQPITNPALIAAGDVNDDNTLNAFDLIDIQKLLLFIEDDFPQNTPAWKVVSEDDLNSDTFDPFMFDVVADTEYDLLEQGSTTNWITFKMGDISLNDVVPGSPEVIANKRSQLDLLLADQEFEKGETVEVVIPGKYLSTLYGLQGSFIFDDTQLLLDQVAATKGLNHRVIENEIAWTWHQAILDEADPIVFSFTALTSGVLSEAISLNGQKMKSLAANSELQESLVNYQFEEAEQSMPMDFALLQNFPNPALDMTTISWMLPSAEAVELKLYNQHGALVKSIAIDANKGLNTLDLETAELGSGQFYLYQLNSSFGSITRKMIILK